jgi:hypothetical protein
LTLDNVMDDCLNLQFDSNNIRAALIVGHPGHELLVHGWLETARPLVFVLTDGSGRSNHSRLPSTTKILEQTGAKAGSIYGRLTDAAAYAAILNHDFDFFSGLANELRAALAAERIDYVVGDAFEGYNPMHDVCRLVINAAVTMAQREREQPIQNLEFSLLDRHQPPIAGGICRHLDDASFARKIAAAKGYAELAGEVHAALERTSTDALRIECLRPVGPGPDDDSCAVPPFYESYGEKKVAAGHYRRVLRYHEHIAPLAEALKRLPQDLPLEEFLVEKR